MLYSHAFLKHEVNTSNFKRIHTILWKLYLLIKTTMLQGLPKKAQVWQLCC